MVIANGDNIYTINDVMAGKKVGTLFLAKDRGDMAGNELAPVREQFRRQAKRRKKEGINKELAGNVIGSQISTGGQAYGLHAGDW